MKRVVWLVATLLTLVLILAGIAALVLTTHPVEIDVTPFKDRITASLGRHTGLVFRVDGELHLRVGPRLGLQGEGLHAKNPGLDEAEDLLIAEKAALEVEALPLLGGRFEPTTLRLEGAEVRLVREASGRWNWQADTRDQADEEEGEDAKVFFFPDALYTDLEDVRCQYRDRRSGTSIDAVLKTARVEPAEAGLKIDLEGSVNGHPLRLRGNTATLSQLIEGTQPVPLDLQGNLLGLDVKADGTLANPRSGARVTAKLRVEGKSLAGLRPWIGEQMAAQGPVKAVLDLKGGGTSYELEPFDLSLGKGRFDGALKADLSKRKPKLDLDLGIEEVDLTPLFRNGKPGGGGTGKSAETEVFTDEPLALAWMEAADLQARIRLRNLITPYTSMRDVDMEVGLASRHLSVKGRGRGKGGKFESFDMELNAGVDPYLASFRYRGDKLSIAPLLAATNARGMISGEVDISLDFKATGNNGNRMAGSLSGNLLFLVEHAKADLRQLDRLTPGVVNLFGQLARPGAESAKVNCALAAFAFERGKTDVNALVDTPDSTVVADGYVDLGAERLDIRVTPDAKGVHLKVAAPVVIQGSLASPGYRVEGGGLLVSLTELVSKIAVPQLLVVDAFGDAVSENPCVKIASGKVAAQQAEPLDVVTEPVGAVVKGAGAVVEGTGKAVKEVGGAVVKGTGGLIKGVGSAVGGLLGGGRPQKDAGADKDPQKDGENSFLE